MKKLIVMLMLLVILISFSSSTEANASTNRFELIQSTSWCDVIVDTETGVEYAFSTGAYNYGGMTVLVDETGNPLIWKGE